MLDIEAEIGFAQLGLGSVLRQNQLTVPANQRDYAWTEKEVKALFRDFAKSIADGERSYFLGTIVTIPRANGVLEVVDGQQRLGTTAIFLSRLGNYLRTRDRLLAEAVDEFLTGIDRTNRARFRDFD